MIFQPLVRRIIGPLWIRCRAHEHDRKGSWQDFIQLYLDQVWDLAVAVVAPVSGEHHQRPFACLARGHRFAVEVLAGERAQACRRRVIARP